MSSVSFGGIGTGVDWSKLVEAEVQARTERVISPLERWKASWQDKLSAYDELRSLLTDLQSSVEAIDTASELKSYAVESSNEDALGALVNGSAGPGTHSLEINQLAAAESEVHSGVDEAFTPVNSSGSTLSFAYTYAGQSTSINVPDGTTLEQLVGLINNDPNNPGVTASVLDDGGGGTTSHHLVLRGDEMGADNTIAVDGATTLAGDWGSLTADAAAGASSVTVDDASPFQQYQAIIIDDDDSAAEYHVINSVSSNTLNLKGTLAGAFSTAQNAYTTPRGMGSGVSAAASAGSSQISVADTSPFEVGKTVVVADAGGYEQLTISAVDATAGTLTFESNLAADYASDAYVTQLAGGRKFSFAPSEFTEVQAARNAQLRVDGYPAGGWIERDSNVVDDVIEGVTLTLHQTTAGSAVNVTVSEDVETVKEKIQEFVDGYNSVRSFVNQKTDYDPESDEAGVLMGSYAANIIESKLRSILLNMAPGFQTGVDTYTHLGQIGIEQSGIGEEASLGTLTVDETELEGALTEDFDAVIRLFTDDFEGYSNSKNLTFYQASSLLTQAGKYDVEADFDAGGALTAGRIKLTDESTFRSATVDSPYLVGQSDNPESGLWVRTEWDGASSTQTAVVRVTRGMSPQLRDALEEILNSADGLLQNIGESYRGIIDQIDERIESEERRIELLRERLTEKYARLEQYMVQMQGQQGWAESMASSMQWT